jgi:hypothetical protein
MYHRKIHPHLRYPSQSGRPPREGEEIHIWRRRVIARLPPKAEKPAEMPDFLARQRKMFGKKRFKISGASQLAQERDRF